MSIAFRDGLWGLLALLVFCAGGAAFAETAALPEANGGAALVIAGEARDARGKPLSGVVVRPDGAGPGVEAVTGDTGSFYLPVPGAGAEGAVKVNFEKRGYKVKSAESRELSAPDGRRTVSHTAELERTRGPAFYIAGALLILTYVLIAFELLHRTLAALLGAVAALFISHTLGRYDDAYFLLSFDEAVRAVDFNVVFLLLGMMIIVGILKETGLFEWLTYHTFRLSGGNVFVLAALLMGVTAVVSAFLDNVTTMMLMVPLTIDIALVLGMNPLALLMPEVLASNIGGTATLIGDPPNIMIGSYTGLTFNDFLMNLTPVIAIITVLHIVMMSVFYRGDYLAARPAEFEKMLARLKGEYVIKDGRLLAHSLLVLGGVIFLFFMHGWLRMEPSVAALGGAAILLLASRESIVKHLERDVEWSTLVFFIMLFVLIGACERTGLIEAVADMAVGYSGGSLLAAVLIVLVLSAVTSAVIDNIPYTATMLPVVAYLTTSIPHQGEVHVLWWALALGACLGGNATLVGASANVVTAGLAEKEGHPIGFIYFMKVGIPVTVMSIVVGALWLVFVEM